MCWAPCSSAWASSPPCWRHLGGSLSYLFPPTWMTWLWAPRPSGHLLQPPLLSPDLGLSLSLPKSSLLWPSAQPPPDSVRDWATTHSIPLLLGSVPLLGSIVGLDAAGSGLPLSVFVLMSLSSRPFAIPSSPLKLPFFFSVSALYLVSSLPVALSLLVSLWIPVPRLISLLSARPPPSYG